MAAWAHGHARHAEEVTWPLFGRRLKEPGQGRTQALQQQPLHPPPGLWMTLPLIELDRRVSHLHDRIEPAFAPVTLRHRACRIPAAAMECEKRFSMQSLLDVLKE
jgi:hypothetical protein